MDVIYGLLPLMILLGLVSVALMFWAARSGQFDDMEGDANRILMDEDIDVAPEQPKQSEEKEDTQEGT
jgi:cbb3-type cytochrome oxidase maturation protein